MRLGEWRASVFEGEYVVNDVIGVVLKFLVEIRYLYISLESLVVPCLA